jgi:hypothetical protein
MTLYDIALGELTPARNDDEVNVAEVIIETLRNLSVRRVAPDSSACMRPSSGDRENRSDSRRTGLACADESDCE